MADEIAQYCQIEIEGFKLLVKGSVELATYIGRLLKALFQKGKEGKTSIDEKKIKTPGEKETFAQLLKLSEGGQPQGMLIDARIFDEFVKIAEKNGLHYWKAIDFDPNDKLIPIMVPPQEYSAFGQISTILTERKKDEDKQECDVLEKKINETKEKLRNALPESEEARILAIQLENYTQAGDEAKKWVEHDEKLLSDPDKELSFSLTDYLHQCKGTDFETNPEIAMAELEKGVEIGPKIPAVDCFQPIRHKSMMPESKVMFYIPETDMIVTRDFCVDKDTDLVYSVYSFKMDDGEIKTYSDRHMTKEEWNKSFLPEMLQNANMLEGSVCRAFDSQEKLDNYIKYHGTIENPAKEKIAEKVKNGEQVFSSAETKHEVLHAISEQDKGFASANVNGNAFEIICSASALAASNRNGKLDLPLSENEHIQFSSVSVEAVIGDKGPIPDSFKLRFDENSRPEIIRKEGDNLISSPITLKEAKDRISDLTNASSRTVIKNEGHKNSHGR